MTLPTWELLPLDCRQAMPLCMDVNSVDSVVTDAPYDLTTIVRRFGGDNPAPAQFGRDGAFRRLSHGFMRQGWDGTGIAFDPDTWREVWRVLKPGGHLLAFGGTRTYHRMASAIEDAGFEIRDQLAEVLSSDVHIQTFLESLTYDQIQAFFRCVEESQFGGMLAWIYGSGFPKSHSVSKQLRRMNSTQAEDWEGWGTALKPALEPIVLARKPFTGSVAANVLQHGTGAINIDGCRIEGEPVARIGHSPNSTARPGYDGGLNGGKRIEPSLAGRFPANLMHDGSDDAMAVFPSEAGAAAPVRGDEPSNVTNGIYGHFNNRVPGAFYNDSGSAARFFYCAKANGGDREEGCDDLPFQVADQHHQIPRSQLDEDRRAGTVPRRNHHPTVKPTALMRYLCRLVTPPGGIVFDPFAGSGSTGKAALLEGFSFIGCEMTPEYIPIAEARLAHALQFWAERNVA